MAVNISFGLVGPNADSTKFPALMAGTISTATAITPSASNQECSIAAPSANYACRIATSAAIFVAFGPTPDATVASARVWMPANSVEYFHVDAGTKVAVVTG